MKKLLVNQAVIVLDLDSKGEPCANSRKILLDVLGVGTGAASVSLRCGHRTRSPFIEVDISNATVTEHVPFIGEALVEIDHIDLHSELMSSCFYFIAKTYSGLIFGSGSGQNLSITGASKPVVKMEIKAVNEYTVVSTSNDPIVRNRQEVEILKKLANTIGYN